MPPPGRSDRGQFGRGRADDGGYLGHYVGREAALLGVLLYHLRVGCGIDAVDFIGGDVAVFPLNLWAHFVKYAARGL